MAEKSNFYGIVKIETNFLGKNQATKLGIEPATFRATAKHATYCATEATTTRFVMIIL
jgi:hypothetical protein